jgi:hypothetical protein
MYSKNQETNQLYMEVAHTGQELAGHTPTNSGNVVEDFITLWPFEAWPVSGSLQRLHQREVSVAIGKSICSLQVSIAERTSSFVHDIYNFSPGRHASLAQH